MAGNTVPFDPKQLSFALGKPMTEEEFKQYRLQNPAARLVQRLQAPDGDLHARLRSKLQAMKEQRTRKPPPPPAQPAAEGNATPAPQAADTQA